MGNARGHDDRGARLGCGFLAAEGEVGFAVCDDETLVVAGVEVLGDHPPGTLRQLNRTRSKSLLPAAVNSIPSPRSRVEGGPEAGHRPVSLIRRAGSC
jgi:hypothetical protein